MTASTLHFIVVQFLASFALVTASAFASEPGAINRVAADGCLPDAGDVFRPRPPERSGRIVGDHEPVLTDLTSDGFLRVAFPMTEVRTGSDQIRQRSIVEAQVVSIDVIVYAGRPVVSPVCMSLVRDGNVFAVWPTVGFFEVVRDTTGTPRLRFFAIVDRSH
jgi:hypothetical protein